jgi:ligand-binding sensor domain-containing protein
VLCLTATGRANDVRPAPDGSGAWVATDGGLLRFDADGSLARKYTRREGLASHGVREIALDPGGALWVATDRGVNRIDGEVVTRFTTRDGLPDDTILAVAADAEGRVLAGTRRGVAILEGDRFRPVLDTHEFGRRATWAVHPARDGSVWFAKENALTRWTPDGNWQVWQRDPLLPGPHARLIDNTVRAIATDERGRPWIGTPRGIGRLDETGWTHLDRTERLAGAGDLRADRVVTLASDPARGVWAGHGDTEDGLGAGLWDGRAWRYLTTGDGLPDDRVDRVRVDDSGDVWFATGRGAAVWHEGRFRIYEAAGDLPSNHVTAIRAATNGTVRVGTASGDVFFSTVGDDPGRIEPTERSGPASTEAGGDGSASVAVLDGGLVLDGGPTIPLPRGARVEPVVVERTPRGAVWVGTARRGLLLWKGGHWSEARLWGLRLPPGITALHLDERGALWVGTAAEGLIVVRPGSTEARR